eukprot:m.316736 g.316736  ORF g.316736 m.316736 type:complete len:54 (+) comp1335526_c0_seq1:36-197(+)
MKFTVYISIMSRYCVGAKQGHARNFVNVNKADDSNPENMKTPRAAVRRQGEVW